MKRRILTILLLIVTLFTANTVNAQAPVDSPEQAITGLLNRIGGNGAADKFEIVIDANLAENGKDVFVITAQNGKPCIKGNTQLSVATGINWYLNHHAHINLTWNNLTTDLVSINLPVPAGEDKHVSNATYRYDFNTCTFSYSMAFWTWERWQQEIDWMALHGINAPLNLVGLDVVTRKFLRELGVSENDINAYIAGPGFIAWFAMNNLEGWGGTINANDVTMNGNPDWWYTRQENLCRNMLQRMRELGMQPVIPGFSGQVPNSIVNYSINGFSSGDVVNNGTWAGGYTRPDILKPNTQSYRTFAAVYYKHLHEVMGVSELYSIDPFHEGSLPSGVSNETCYPNIMVELDNYYNGVSQEDKAKNNVDEQPKWIIQYWQGVPQSGAFSAMSSYGDRFIGLDLFSDAPGKAKWNTDYFQSRPYIFCMLHNFGGRSGLHGRLESTMNDYFRAIAKGNNCQGIGATPEGTETNPILYDMLFELPWMDTNNRPTADEWLAEYSHSRYGIKNDKALSALQNLKKSVWACPTDQQGTSEAVILARPNWTVGSVSSWSTSAIYWDTQDVLLAADQLSSISDLITTADGTANYNYDFIDVVRQAMVDYAAQLLPLINAARGNDAEYTRLYQLYLQLMLDLDEMLSYDENFKLERWTSLARNIADEVEGTTENDRRWLEWNARTQVTVWSKGDTDLHDYSNRCWAGLIKDFHYKRWEKFFTTNGGSFSGGWYSGFEYPWTVDFTNYNYSTVTIPSDMTATAKAKETFGKYFGRVTGKEKNYIFPMGVTTNATKKGAIPEVYRGQEVELPLEIGKNVTISSVNIDLNADGKGETLTANGNKVTIPADAVIGQTTAKVTYSDNTIITFDLALVEEITEERTVTAVAGANGTVAIEGTNELTITNTEAVKITATANTGYNFNNWTDANGEVVSNNNPFIYYGKEDATFTANFIQDKWGVVACNGSLSGDIASYAQFIHNLTFAYYNREAETIFETTTAPTEIFNTIPQIINVPQGASFDVEYNNGGSDGLKYCYFRAFIDLNADGDFNDEGELLKEVGTNGAANTAVCSNKINVLLPYDMPLGITHMRLRFDGAWDNNSNPSGRGAKDASVRPVYEIIINVTDKSDKAANIKVESNNNDWGTVEVWTDETPDGSTSTEWNVTKGVPFYLRATKASEDAEFLGWYDQYGRLVTENLEHTMYAREDATYTAKFRKFLEIDGWEFEYRTESRATIARTVSSDVVILTKVRQSGNHDLVIPETVNILGENLKIVGFDDNLFNNNKDLWSIELPKSIEFLSEKSLLSGTMTGTIAPGNGRENAEDYTVYNLESPIKASDGFKVIVKGITNGSTYNQWGSGLFATGENPLSPAYQGGFQFYLSKDGSFVIKVNNSNDDEKVTIENCKAVADTEFTATIIYKDNNVTINIDNGNGQTATNTRDCTLNDISAFSAAIPTGISLNISVESLKENNPFSGCTNLFSITVEDGNENYKVQDNALYNTGNTVLHRVANNEKEDELRALGELIDLTKVLTAEVATIDPTGKKSAITLSTTVGENYYIYSNAEIREGTIGNLLDNNNDSYIHTTWEKNSADGLHHYLRVYLGEEPSLTNFSFSYVTRNNTSNHEKPKQITVSGCATIDGEYETIAILKDLPKPSLETYNSPVFEVKGYKYLRFMVDDTYRDLSHSGHKAYSMAEFDLFKLTSTAEVVKKYKNLAGVTATDVENVYDNMADALYYYNYDATAEQLQAAYNTLEPLYTALNTKKNKILNGVYKLQAKTYMDDNGEHLFENEEARDVFVAYNTDATDNPHSTGYKLIAKGTYTASAEADKYFTIIPHDDGYTLQAQGLYVKAPQNLSQWGHILCTDNAEDAGYYLLVDAGESLYKLQNINSGNNHLNVWESQKNIFGNEKSAKFSKIAIEQVEEYALTVPESGMTTLCLPFNVVLPAGVDAYDVTFVSNSFYDMTAVATEGDILAKNTPVVIKAAAGSYTLTITMDEEGAKSSIDNSVLRGTFVKSTVGTSENNYLLTADATFNRVTNNTEVAANSCWMELNTQIDTPITKSPVVLTTDEENPVLYKIIIKRADDESKVLRYDNNDNMVAVGGKANDTTWQAWYFMGGTNGVTIHPFNADGKVLSADNTGNSPAKVWAVKKGEKAFYEWKFVSRADGYFNIQARDGSNYFSNNGGEDYKMGFWSDDPDTDGGSLFKFIDAEFTNDNARFYQLSDVKATMANIYCGTSVGLYTTESVNNYREAYTTATTLVSAGSASSSCDDCYTAYKALRAANANLEYNAADPAKLYVIKSTANDEYCKGKYVHTNRENITVSHWLWGNMTYNQNHLKYEAIEEIDFVPLAVFQFEETDIEGEYKMKNLHTGLYVKSFGKNAEHMGDANSAAKVKISGVADGQVKLQIGNSDPMHAQEDYSVIVGWGAEANNASTWIIDEVANIEDVKHTLTISAAGYSTLYLNYPVAIPDGVKAYTANFIKDAYFSMNEITGVIPARTAVIIEGEEGEYDFVYSTEGGESVSTISENDFEFSGTLWDDYLGGTNDAYYILSSIDDAVGMYKTLMNKNESGAEGNTHFKNNANKAYLKIEGSNSSSSFEGFRLDYSGTTDINDVTVENEEVKAIYDLQGRRIKEITKPGLYIINGCKVLVK
ncbi:MAG: alpha-N-acetylglucosaminidase [Bacteroidaceae bacterium]|nr:alpha-N-acetylglucosaminidase [Bacteroidaceae bacterium]